MATPTLSPQQISQLYSNLIAQRATTPAQMADALRNLGAEIPAPSDEDVWEVLQRIIKRVMKQLVRRGILVEDQGPDGHFNFPHLRPPKFPQGETV